jgi:two-component system LytT family response regulator
MKMISINTVTHKDKKHTAIFSKLPGRGKKIALPTLEGYLFRKVEKITVLQAQGNYTQLYFDDSSKILVCKTLSNMEEMLSIHPQFIRIHRSYTINLDHIERYVKGKGGYIILENGQSVSVSNSRKAAFFEALETYY